MDELLEGDLHGKRVQSLANATLGVMVSASLVVAAIERSLAQRGWMKLGATVVYRGAADRPRIGA